MQQNGPAVNLQNSGEKARKVSPMLAKPHNQHSLFGFQKQKMMHNEQRERSLLN